MIIPLHDCIFKTKRQGMTVIINHLWREIAKRLLSPLAGRTAVELQEVVEGIVSECRFVKRVYLFLPLTLNIYQPRLLKHEEVSGYCRLSEKEKIDNFIY